MATTMISLSAKMTRCRSWSAPPRAFPKKRSMASARVVVLEYGQADSGSANCSARNAALPACWRCAIDAGGGPNVVRSRKRPLLSARGHRAGSRIGDGDVHGPGLGGRADGRQLRRRDDRGREWRAIPLNPRAADEAVSARGEREGAEWQRRRTESVEHRRGIDHRDRVA